MMTAWCVASVSGCVRQPLHQVLTSLPPFHCFFTPILPFCDTHVPITNMRFPVSDLWSQCTSNKLNSVQPVIGRNRNPSLSRYDSVLINRLRVGHTRLTNSYLLKGENQPKCQMCHSPLTVEHILIDCTCFGAARQIYLGVDTLK